MQRLRKAGLTRGSVDLGRIERAARFSDAPVAFAVLRREGLTLAVQPERLRLASLTYALAVRQVVSFGLALLRRIGFLARTEDLNFVRAVLTAKDSFEWLDRRVGWFRFGNGSSQLVRTIESILTVAGPVPLKELAHVLFRRWAPDNAPSGRTLRALCSQIPSLQRRRQHGRPEQPGRARRRCPSASARCCGCSRAAGRRSRVTGCTRSASAWAWRPGRWAGSCGLRPSWSSPGRAFFGSSAAEAASR